MKEYETDPTYMEALEWFVLLNDDKATPEDRRAFAAWLQADPAHAAAFERAQSLWDRFDIVKPEFERVRRSRQLTRRNITLGGLALALAAPTAWYMTRPGFLADHRTGVAERRIFTLPDGSTAELGSHSALSVDFTDRQRRLILHRGQAFFTVAPDVARPFAVEAGAGAVRALGTRFDVKLLDGEATVSVVEHAVSVSLQASAPVEVAEGWQVRYDETGIGAPRPADLMAVEAWRDDRIVFEDAPLRLVLRELERYRRGRIILMDGRLGDMPVTAVFDTRQTEAALATIEATLPVGIVDAAGFVALVYGR